MKESIMRILFGLKPSPQKVLHKYVTKRHRIDRDYEFSPGDQDKTIWYLQHKLTTVKSVLEDFARLKSNNELDQRNHQTYINSNGKYATEHQSLACWWLQVLDQYDIDAPTPITLISPQLDKIVSRGYKQVETGKTAFHKIAKSTDVDTVVTIAKSALNAFRKV